MSPSVIALVIAVVALAGMSAFLYARSLDARSRADERGAELTRLTAQLTTAGTAHAERERVLPQQVRTAEIGLATLKATLEKEREAAAAKLTELQEAETRLRDAFDYLRKGRTTHRATSLLKNFGDATVPITEQIHALQRQSASLPMARALLLPRLLSGQVEPAEN